MRRIVSPFRGFDSPLGVGVKAYLRWILSNGFWRDYNVWLDSETWNDGV